ncbi:MAG: ABC transporter ATP-binding protein/permease [Lachnospiraceae bacterium]|jgi:ATP-binding cassette subfamily B protein|nr:ABC transporter ATP-binding protein/permease [Lachnospiraceae bacterium]MCH4064179.1 ABC transporter ATP-binding protein/permease [Lachnospiraceae bacterium]MCH4103096.1 ABC transporter ATP-binding protein/permease [Lachnospiraceae bacterium]MCI1308759.1 ABC transporter ATP-binding protein/permease [Lachnospiraceae bacterium]MCI1333851.1 ABC transporter ATP-binding protein/permease [Lachnospiraceae bacterium]
MSNTSRKPDIASQAFARHPGRGGVVEKPKNGKKTLRRLLRYFKPEMFLVIVLFLVVAVSVITSVIAPAFQSSAIDLIVDGSYSGLPRMLFLMMVVYLISGAATLASGWISAALSQRIVRRLRSDLFERIVYLPLRYIDNHSHGDLISRMTNDADNISNIVSQSLSSLLSGILTLIGTIVMMLWYSVPLTLISCSTVVLSVIATAFLTKYMSRYFLRRQELLGDLNGTVEEYVTNCHTVTAYNRQEPTIRAFSDTADRLTHVGIIAEIIGGSMGPVMNMLSNVAFVVVAVFGAYFALKGWITIGVISAFIIYSKQFSRPINQIAQLYGQIETAIAGAERIFAILDENEEQAVVGTDSADRTQSLDGRIEFRHVNFSYVPEKRVINDFSLTIEPGRKIALVGSTGSGKTTIINLLMRFYDIDSGEILLDGRDIRSIPLPELRGRIGIVLQDTVLFTDTVRNNLTYADPSIPDEEVREAAHLSNADKVISHLKNGYDTVLTESGGSLSQGQRQLIAIGRVFASKPDILILDEATSSVDTRTEQNIQDAMANLMRDRTSLIIAHRLSTIQDVDEIIVMDQGRIVETGNHRELLAKKGRYYELYMTQFAGQAT